MNNNLFLQSIQHLIIKSQAPVVEAQVAVTPLQVKIFIDKGVVCHSVEEACVEIIKAEKEMLPDGFRNFVTGNLLRGTIDKQIDSVFKDFKKYGKQVVPKILSFFEHISLNKEAYLKYIEKLEKDLSPEADAKNGKIDSTYFKIWFLYNYLKENNPSRTNSEGEI